jgi:hypothetical protein
LHIEQEERTILLAKECLPKEFNRREQSSAEVAGRRDRRMPNIINGV